MPGNRFVVLAESPDDPLGFVIGPVYSDEACTVLAIEVAEAGWKGTGIRQHLSAAAFRSLVAGGKTAATAAGEGNGDG